MSVRVEAGDFIRPDMKSIVDRLPPSQDANFLVAQIDLGQCVHSLMRGQQKLRQIFCPKLFEAASIGLLKPADRRALKVGHDRFSPQRARDVASQRPNIRPRATDDIERKMGVVEIQQLQSVDLNRPCGQFDMLSLPRQRVRSPPRNLQGRIGGGHLLDRTHKTRQDRHQFVLPYDGWLVERDQISLHVLRVALHAQPKPAAVRLRHPLDVLDQPSGLAQTQHKHAFGKRVECAGMADFHSARDALHAIHHVARGDSGRLVKIQQSKHGSPYDGHSV